MEERLNTIYGKIANKLNDIIPEQWDKIYMYGEVSEDVRETFFYYFTPSKDEPVYSHYIPNVFNINEMEYYKSLEQLLDLLKELWLEFKNNDQEAWTNLTFVLESTGKFKVDYDYTDLSEADPNEWQILWEYKYLGAMPEDDDDKLIVEEYLKTLQS
ncbi:MAG: DUF600 family protein [Clostridiaceae bacterium]|nr:DUF600 family protein [Clostridiaceae bacterium]